MGMLDHLGCLAILTEYGGRPDLTETLIRFRNGFATFCAKGTAQEDVPLMEEIVTEMMLVRLTFEEASACLASRN